MFKLRASSVLICRKWSLYSINISYHHHHHCTVSLLQSIYNLNYTFFFLPSERLEIIIHSTMTQGLQINQNNKIFAVDKTILVKLKDIRKL